MARGDQLHRFTFEHAGARGVLVHLDASWRAVLKQRDYPETVRDQLGQGMAAAALLSAIIKFQGSLVLQAQGSGPLTTVVAQASHERTLRSMARWRGDVPRGSLPQVFGQGEIVLTVEPTSGERYQGIVALLGDGLADALQTYFARSEQLHTLLWLAADQTRAAGLLLQVMPSEPGHEDDWERIAALAGTLSTAELLSLDAEPLLHRLFHQERVRLYEPEPLAFRCTCSRERIADTLRAMGGEEIERLLQQQDAIEVDCEFCNRRYRFDSVDIARPFTETAAMPLSSRPH